MANLLYKLRRSANSPNASILRAISDAIRCQCGSRSKLPDQLVSPIANNSGIPGGPRFEGETPYYPIGFSDPLTGGYPAAADAILFGYLSQIWELLWYGVGFTFHGTAPDVARIDSLRGGFKSRVPLVGDYVFEELSAVVVEIISYPQQSDLIFGDPPLINAGYCGWGWESNTTHFGEVPVNPPPEGGEIDFGLIFGGQRNFFGGLIQNIFFQEAPFARTRPENINNVVSVFFPPSRNCVDFWWHLQEGVRANIHAYGPRQLLGTRLDWSGKSVPFNPGDSGSCPEWFPEGAPYDLTSPDGTSCTGGT